MTIKVFTVAQMVAAEQAADAAGWSYDEMMETAGRRVAEAIRARWDVDGLRVTILVGPGNNGGDGLVAGHYLAEAGADVTFYLYKERDPEQDANLRRVREAGLDVLTAGFDQRYRVLRHRLAISDLVVDSLLGTGVDRPIEGELANLMRQAAAGLEERRTIVAERQATGLVGVAVPPPAAPVRGPLVVAVDCPSGLHCDTGELDRLALPADLTVTFAGPKRGHFLFPGAAACGELVVAEIGIDPELKAVAGVDVVVAEGGWMREMVGNRPVDGHKGTFGKVLIGAGSDRYRGAPLLAARAAYRAGAGLVTIGAPDVVRHAAASLLPEVTFLPLTSDDGDLSPGAGVTVGNAAHEYDALLLGPGLDDAGAFLEAVLERADALPPLVVDADGLNLLAGWSRWWKEMPARSVLTPHPGEMARLMDVPLGELRERNRFEVAREQAAAWGHVVLLKGAFTIVADPDGRTAVLPFANSLLAVAGSGDVLSGVILALLGQGRDPFEAAVLGGYLHGLAGHLLRDRLGDAGLLVSELADALPDARQALLGKTRS